MRTTGQQIVADSEITEALQRAKQLAAPNGGQKKRSITSDDLNFYPAKQRKSSATFDQPKREVNEAENMASMGMGPPMNETLVEAVDIPEGSVGLVIGRGGEQIQMIQQQSGCRVQMAGESNLTGFRQCTLQGPRHCIDKARHLIQDVLERSTRGQTGGGGGGGTQNGGNVTTIELSIPGPKCGLIIGKSGETIKGLQEQLSVKMMLIQESHQPTMGTKPLRISGSPDKVEQAKRMIESLLSGETTASQSNNMSQSFRGGGGGSGTGGGGGMGGGPKSVGEVIVPRSSVGIIIGKGGDTIKRLAAETGAKIQFKPDDPNLQERCAIIQGTPEQISRATQMISELVTRSAGGGQPETFYMHVPANKTGLVIGKGGDTIKQIMGETGAHVELSREPPPNTNEKVFVIKGTQYQIHHVQHIIRIKVGDIAPGTPLPAFHSTGANSATISAPVPTSAPQMNIGNPYGPTAVSHPPQTFNATPAAVTAQDPSAWTQYYNQQQATFPAATAGAANPHQPPTFGAPTAQHYQSIANAGVGAGPPQMGTAAHHHQQQQQQMMQTQQQQMSAAVMGGQPQQPQQPGALGGGPTGTPAINPQTGQPDYSAQWAEYYRTMGMHEQASLIESQMKQSQQPQVVQQRPQQQLYMQ